MGCPAPRIYRKNVGVDCCSLPEKVDRILGELRQAVNDRPLTVKMRVGFEKYRYLLQNSRPDQSPQR